MTKYVLWLSPILLLGLIPIETDFNMVINHIVKSAVFIVFISKILTRNQRANSWPPPSMFTILISGSTLTASIELAYLKGLRLTACKNVQIVKTDNNYTNLTLFFKIYRRLSPNRHLRILEYNKILSKELKKREPGDVLLIFKGMDVLPETLRMAKKKGLFIVIFKSQEQPVKCL